MRGAFPASLLLAAVVVGCVAPCVAQPEVLPVASPTLGPLEVVVPVPVPASAPVEVRSGIASWVPASLGRSYLALPDGPGVRVRVCGAGGCWTATSNDAGPDRAMQREGRIVDLAVGRWESVCGVDRLVGLCQVTVEVLE